MKKGIPIFLGLIVAVLMLTSFISAVSSEIMIAKNAVLAVQSHPVIASDATISALEPETYDAMIDSYNADKHAFVPESDQNSDRADSSETGMEPAMPVSSDFQEPDDTTAAALVNESDSGNSNDPLLPATSDEAGTVQKTNRAAPAASTIQINDPVNADNSEKTIKADAAPEQDGPSPLYASLKIRNDNVIEPASPVTTDNNTVFTVQAGSYCNRFLAEIKYKSIIHNMNAADLDNLRIEKVGDYYTVRLGRFDHYVTAMKFLNAMNSKLSSAIVLKAYIKNERIVAQHDNALLAGK
jgi:hypothetical protein